MKRGIIYRIFLSAAVILSAAALIIFPSEAADMVRSSLSVCASTIIPTLFPLMCVSVFMVESGMAADVGKIFSPIMRPLFNLPDESAPAFILGLIGGYPVGARTAIALYERGTLDKTQTEKLLAFCNNSGPAFILGTVGAGVFRNLKIGAMLYFAHILASITVGILFRNYRAKSPAEPAKKIASARQESAGIAQSFSRAAVSSAQPMINICAFVVLFSVATRMLFLAGIIPFISALFAGLAGISPGETEGLLTGLLEVASGALSLKDAASSMPSALAMTAFMLGWAGISVHFQMISFIGQKRLSILPYLVGKLSHGLLSALYIKILSLVIPLEMEVSSYLAQSVEASTGGDLTLTLLSSLIFSSAILISGALVSILSEKN